VLPASSDQRRSRVGTHYASGERHWKRGHYLKGTVYCGLCHRRLIFTKCTGKQGIKYDYFVCGGRHDGSGCQLPYLPVHKVEHFIAAYYLRKVKLDAEHVSGLEPRLIELFGLLTGYRQREADRRRTEVERILGKRRQLVADHARNPQAIPLDVLAEQHEALGQKLAAARRNLANAEADVGKAEKGLRLARRFLHHSSRTYREADPQTRRRCNQAFFTRLFVGPDGITAAELTEEFGALLAKSPPARLNKLPSGPRAFRARGSNVAHVVRLRGLEPPRGCPHRHLKPARLPIPPQPRAGRR
jgi:site-specific DNA recombinase